MEVIEIEVIKIEVIKIEIIKIEVIEVIKIEIIKIEVTGCLTRLILCFRQNRVSYVVFKLIVRVGVLLGGWLEKLRFLNFLNSKILHYIKV